MTRDQPLSPNLDEQVRESQGYGTSEGPESQGAFAGDGFGDDAQGDFGDEDYDTSYASPSDAGELRLDERLEAEVRDRLVEEFGTDPVDVAVSVTGGIALLDGLVDELAARDAMEEMALDVPGIRAVDNRLRQRR